MLMGLLEQFQTVDKGPPSRTLRPYRPTALFLISQGASLVKETIVLRISAVLTYNTSL